MPECERITRTGIQSAYCAARQLSPLCACAMHRFIRQIAVLVSIIATLASATATSAQQPAIPTPESSLGFTVGADFKLATYDESIAYFQKLAAATNRIHLIDVGKTSTGHAWTLAVISSPENLARLDRLKEIAQRIAHPTGLTDAEAHRLAAEGKVFVDISGGLHASEIAGSQHTIQLAYDLLSRPDDPKVKAILDNTVLFLWPSINPDGQNIVVNWYRENVGTPYEISPLHEVYQKYIGHDNNRDAYMLNVVESRVVARTWREWEPQIIYVQHQTAPFPTRIWLPPFAEPIAPRVPALMSRQVNTIGMTIAQALESNGQVGATHMGTGFDAWYPGYIDYMPMLQNINVVLDRDGALSLCNAALLHAGRLPARHARPPTAVALPEPMARRLVAAQGRGGLHAYGVHGDARLRKQVSRGHPLQPLPGWPQRHQALCGRAAVCVRDPAVAT